MWNPAHADKSRRNTRSRPYKLNRALRVRFQSRQVLGDKYRQVSSQPALKYRRTGHNGNSQFLAGLDERSGMRAHFLICAGVCLGHGEVVRQLDDFEVMLVARHITGTLDDVFDGYEFWRIDGYLVAILGGSSIHANLACPYDSLQKAKGDAKPFVKLAAINFR